MIPLIREKVLLNGWLSDAELMNMIAVSESTPGPIAVNIATFIGAGQGGLVGAFVATLGVVLPSFVIILVIANLVKNFLKVKGFSAFLSGIRPCIVGLIISTAILMFINNALGLEGLKGTISPDISAIIILVILLIASKAYKLIIKKDISPILLIVLSAVCGIILYGRI